MEQAHIFKFSVLLLLQEYIMIIPKKPAMIKNSNVQLFKLKMAVLMLKSYTTDYWY